jgi:hypothetical protein
MSDFGSRGGMDFGSMDLAAASDEERDVDPDERENALREQEEVIYGQYLEDGALKLVRVDRKRWLLEGCSQLMPHVRTFSSYSTPVRG